MRDYEPLSPAAPDAGESAERPLSVLIAEDDPILAEVLSMALEKLGCRVACADDGEAALKLLRERQFDTLVSDWMMPKLDGLALVRQARAEQSRYLHIIMMTARGQERSIRAALEAGADDFLYKPFDDIQIELGIASARRVVDLQRRLERRNRHLAAAHERTRAAYDQIKADLRAAAELQHRLLPQPRTSGAIRMAYSFQPSLDIGGDSLGVRELSRGRLLFFNIDVSGHGVPAALNSFALHTRLSQLNPREPDDLPSIAALLNRELLAQEGDAYFTIVFGLVEADGSKVWLIRAGHPMPVLMRRGAAPIFLEPGGMPLGMLPNVSHEICEVELGWGDRILLYSDGVTESGLGEDGLLASCSSHESGGPSAFIDSLNSRLLRGGGGSPPQDDISMMLIERSETETSQ